MNKAKSQEPQKILFFSHTPNANGGAEAALLEVVKYLSSNNYIIPYFIVPGEGTLTDELKAEDIPYYQVKFSPWYEPVELSDTQKQAKARLNISTMTEMIKIVDDIKPDVLFTNTIVAPWLGITAAYTKKPHIWMLHEYGDLDHGFIFDYGYKKTLQIIDKLSSAVVVNSKALLDHVDKDINKEKITQIHYAIADNSASSAKPINEYKRKTSFKCLILGRITKSKGQLDALMALKNVVDQGYDVELLIIGNVESKDYLKEITNYIGESKLQDFVTILEHKTNPYPYISSADVVLMCSVNEAFGRVTAESMLLGKPVIGSNKGGTVEIVDDGQSGLIYAQGNTLDLANKIIFALSNPKKLKEMGLKATESIKTNFNHSSSEDKVLKLLSEVKPCENFPFSDVFLDAFLIINEETKGYLATIEQLNLSLKNANEQSQRTKHDLELVTNSKAWKLARRLQNTSGKFKRS